jgi:hypothetical protein
MPHSPVRKVACALREWWQSEWNLRNYQCVEPYSWSGWLQRYCWQSITTRKRSDEVVAEVVEAVAVAHVAVAEAVATGQVAAVATGQVAAPWEPAEEPIVQAALFVEVRWQGHMAGAVQEPDHQEQ